MSELAERAARVRLLLETLNDPYPRPRSALQPDSGPAPSRYTPCETCRRQGWLKTRDGWTLCLVCNGEGWKRREKGEQPWDAYLELPLNEASELPRASRARSAEPDRGETYLWERLRASYDAHGSYRAVRIGLDWLTLTAPRRGRLVRVVCVDQEPRALDARDEAELTLGLCMIARRIGRVRVPPWLIERTAAEDRRATIGELSAEGLTPGEIARRLGISRRAVQRKIRSDAPVILAGSRRPALGT